MPAFSEEAFFGGEKIATSPPPPQMTSENMPVCASAASPPLFSSSPHCNRLKIHEVDHCDQLTIPFIFKSPSNPTLKPVTWASLGLMAVTGAGLAYYYQGEKEKKQQQGILVVCRVCIIAFFFLERVMRGDSFFYHLLRSLSHTAFHRTSSAFSSPPSLLSTPPQTTQP